MDKMKPRVIKDYDKLDPEIQEQIKLEYPYGFSDNLITFTNKDGLIVSALPFETDDKYYMVRMTVSEASEFKRDHNLWSVLPRYMVLQRPSMLAAVSFRRTPVDSADLVCTWEAIVGPAVFAASTLTEAQGIYDSGAQ